MDSSILTDIKSSNPFFGKLKSGESEAQETAEVTDENQLELPPPPKLPPVGKAPPAPKLPPITKSTPSETTVSKMPPAPKLPPVGKDVTAQKDVPKAKLGAFSNQIPKLSAKKMADEKVASRNAERTVNLQEHQRNPESQAD